MQPPWTRSMEAGCFQVPSLPVSRCLLLAEQGRAIAPSWHVRTWGDHGASPWLYPAVFPQVSPGEPSSLGWTTLLDWKFLECSRGHMAAWPSGGCIRFEWKTVTGRRCQAYSAWVHQDVQTYLQRPLMEQIRNPPAQGCEEILVKKLLTLGSLKVRIWWFKHLLRIRWSISSWEQHICAALEMEDSGQLAMERASRAYQRARDARSANIAALAHCTTMQVED